MPANASGDLRRDSCQEVKFAVLMLRAHGHRPDDYEVMDGGRVVGRIFLEANKNETWFWSVNFRLTHRDIYDRAKSRETAMAAFKAEYERWLKEAAN